MAQPTTSLALDTGEYPQIPYSSALASALNTATWTFETWLQFRTDPNSNDIGLFDFWESGKKHSQFIFYGSTLSNKLYMSVATAVGGTTYADNSQTIPAMAASTWYHVALVYDSGTATLYWKPESGSHSTVTLNTWSNGGPGGTALADMSLASDPKADFQFGFQSDGDSVSLLHDTRVWTTARSSSEIADNSDVDISDAASGLLARYKFASDLTDATSNSLDAEMGNGTASYPSTIPTWAGGSSTSITSVAGVAQADITSIAGVANANIDSIAGVSNSS